MATQIKFITLIFILIILWCNCFTDSFKIAHKTQAKPNLEEICTPKLESLFIGADGKRSCSGFFPVKGSCTAYIPCISFIGGLMRPMKRVECVESAGQAFLIEDMKCRPVPDVKICPQRLCYPEETKKEDAEALALMESLIPPSEKSETHLTTSISDFDLISNPSLNKTVENDTSTGVITDVPALPRLFSSGALANGHFSYHYLISLLGVSYIVVLSTTD